MSTQIDKRLAALAEEKAVFSAELNEILAVDGDFDDVAQARVEEIKKEVAKIDQKVELNEGLKADVANAPRPRAANKPLATIPNTTTPAWESDSCLGYKNEREFFADVMNISSGGRVSSEGSHKLKYLATAGSDEQMSGNDSYGGYLVPEGFLNQLYSVGVEADPVGSRVQMIPMSNPSVRIPARTDKNHSTSVSGGLTVARTHETQAATSSRMQVETITLVANKLTGLSYATDEILNDSAISIAAIIESGFRDQFPAAKMRERIRGTGTGEFEGILNCPAKIEVARETANVITDQDVTAMRARAYNYSNSIWIANHDALVTLMGIYIPFSTISAQPLFAPGNGSDKPDTLLGRPIYFSEYASTLADTGDLILADWSQYLEGTYQGMQNASSMHVRFVEGEHTFKFWERNDGRSWWRSALTPQNGAATLSPFVVLDTNT